METTAYRPSRESRALDSDRAVSHSAAASYIRTRADRSQDDPIPLFLSDPLGAPDPQDFAPRDLRPGARIVPRILAAVLAVSTLAILGALFQSDLRSLVAANAGGSTGAAPDQSAAQVSPPVARQIPLKDPMRVTSTMLASADTQDLPAPSTPSREAIATAYQIALQAQAPAPVAVQPVLPLPASALDADTLAGLMTRANSLIGVGDIAAARLLLERAANAKDATATLLLAQTYDPAVLGTRDTRSVIADVAAARNWYQQAAALGSAEARQRLAQLSN
ncbi:hypothetical protein ABIB73_006952 [Bradyrhizobium sp. F1.4.3]|uniref:hypothetical protein n=1 Tax=Bradyrhizobium sp. F1.4.3 TaxID=3156356 RepID=UPI0033936F84